jgi:outer membrane protein assembly factor BamE (lipoprotein component of BamABCDE complex)
MRAAVTLRTVAYLTANRRRLGCLLTATGVMLVLSVTYAFMTDYLPLKFFNSDDWKKVERSDDNTRLQMVESLMISGRLDGKTQSEVISLLGTPSDTDYFSDWDLVYWLGLERGMISIDSEWLVIRFGRSGRVAAYRVVRD